jgi:hypothetical protein
MEDDLKIVQVRYLNNLSEQDQFGSIFANQEILWTNLGENKTIPGQFGPISAYLCWAKKLPSGKLDRFSGSSYIGTMI